MILFFNRLKRGVASILLSFRSTEDVVKMSSCLPVKIEEGSQLQGQETEAGNSVSVSSEHTPKQLADLKSC